MTYPFVQAASTGFWNRVDRSDLAGCWPWTGARASAGYGNLRWQGWPWSAHRLAWVLTHGSIPAGVMVLHHCDNPPCCNPAHLFLGTAADNSQDMVRKGRGRGLAHRSGVDNNAGKLSDEQVAHIRSLLPGPRGTQARLARQFGVSTSLVSQIARGTHR